MKKADMFLKGFRASYIVLAVLSLAKMLNLEINIILFSFLYFMITFSADVLINNIYLAKEKKGSEING